MNRVFVSGCGMVSSLGKSVNETWDAIVEGKSGVRRMEEWTNYRGLHCHLGAPAVETDISMIPRSARRTMSRMSMMMVHAALEATAQAGIDLSAIDPSRVLICAGSTTGSPQTYKDYFYKAYQVGGPEGQMGTSFFKVMNHSVVSNLAAALNFSGPVLAASAACATSAQAIILGWQYIRSGLYDLVLVGGADELHHTSAEVFDIVYAASRGYNDRPLDAPRPFDKERDGLVVSEGASLMILESEASLRKRGKAALGEILGGAHMSSGSHMSQSDSETMKKVMANSLREAATEKDEIAYVNAHATATMQGDQAEVQAISQLFGENVFVSSLKGHLGHSLSPCGAIEAILTLKMMNEGMLLPTRNLKEVAKECQGVKHLSQVEKHAFSKSLSTNFAFGGINTSVVLGRSPDL